MTTSEKKQFLQTFVDFLDTFENTEYGKCYFEFTGGENWQGWILAINETTFEYLDSGPLSQDEAYHLEIAEINPDTFAYWDQEVKTWTEYIVPDKFENRKRAKEKEPGSEN